MEFFQTLTVVTDTGSQMERFPIVLTLWKSKKQPDLLIGHYPEVFDDYSSPSHQQCDLYRHCTVIGCSFLTYSMLSISTHTFPHTSCMHARTLGNQTHTYAQPGALVRGPSCGLLWHIMLMYQTTMCEIQMGSHGGGMIRNRLAVSLPIPLVTHHQICKALKTSKHMRTFYDVKLTLCMLTSTLEISHVATFRPDKDTRPKQVMYISYDVRNGSQCQPPKTTVLVPKLFCSTLIHTAMLRLSYCPFWIVFWGQGQV